MEHSKRILPTVQTNGSERQPIMDPRAWLLKVAIVRIELQQKDPTFSIIPSPYFHPIFTGWHLYLINNVGTSSQVAFAFKKALLDVFALKEVLRRVEKKNTFREVLTRALRSTREAFLHAGGSHAFYIVNFLPKRHLYYMAASMVGSKQKCVDLDSELAIAYTLRAFLTSVLHLLTSVFQYLIGHVDRGGSKTYSSGAFDFRDSFISLVLFQGAYVWIKFRQAARPGSRKRKAPDVEHQVVDIKRTNLKGVYARPIKEKSSGGIACFKYEPRFTPPKQEGDDGTDLCSKRLPLGEYHTRAEAQIVLQIARYYYDKNGGCVELEDGQCKFLIPPMSEQERGLAGKEKRTWVSCRAKQLGKQMYADFQRKKGKQLAMATEASSHGAESNDPSSSALPLACPSPPTPMTMAVEPALGSTVLSSPSLPSFPCNDAIVGDGYVFSEALSGFEDMFAELDYDPLLPNPLDQQSSVVSCQMQYQEFAQLLQVPSSPVVGIVPRVFEHVSEPELNHSPSFQQGRDLADAGTENIDGRIFLHQSDPVLQQLLLFQKKCLEDNARQFVDLDHRLKAYEIQISKLQQENETLKFKLQQVASLSCHQDWSQDGHSTERLNDFGFLEK